MNYSNFLVVIHQKFSLIFDVVKKFGFYFLILLNLFFLEKYHGIFPFYMEILPNSIIIKTLILINWIFGFAFLPGLIFFIYYFHKKETKKNFALLFLILSIDLILGYFNKAGGVGFAITTFFEKNFSKFYLIPISLVLNIIGNFLLFQKEKSSISIKKTKKAKIKENITEEKKLPSLNLITIGQKISISINLDAQKKALMKVLEDFGIKANIIDIKVGPVVTLYSIELAPGIKSVRLINLADDIARSMQTFSARIATIPGKNLIGIEISNEKRQTVYFKEGIQTEKFDIFEGNLPLYLGCDIHGEHEIVDLCKMPHLLVAGTTGSGKSVGIHTMLLSLLYKKLPSELKLILIDPKKLELTPYEDIPHLLLPVTTEAKEAILSLRWVVKEMEARYVAMSKLGVRNILTFNEKIEQLKLVDEKLPFIVIVVDEMADLMLMAGKELEICVQRLAQMGRAAGIHIIMATQRPSVDVITGTIKANFPTRISFKLSTKIDSRTILGDLSGAEQLLGAGDMLYLATDGKLKRIHGSFISEEDVLNVVNFWKEQGKPDYIQLQHEEEESQTTNSNFDEPYYKEAIELIRSTKKVSTSFLQRNYPIGYNRAAKIIEQMEKEGIITAGDKFGRNREIL